jgi:serine/threonine-protein kinase
MGVVFKACHTTLGHVVALKMILEGKDPDPTGEAIRRFRLEAQAIAQFNHPHIVRLYEFGEQDGTPYFAMAFAAGGNLAQNAARFTEDPRSAVALVEKIARAVNYAHGKGILHRDLKPSNLLLDEKGEPLVGDFGLAKFMDGDGDMTRTGAVLGTPSYMAPEQASGHNIKIGRGTDVWALGVILYELLTGRKPFAADGGGEALCDGRRNEPTTPRRLGPGLDRGLEAIVLHCLEPDPRDRYPSAAALADDLQRWLDGKPPREARSVWARLRRWRQRHSLATGVFLLALLALAGLAVAFTLFDPGRPVKALKRDLGAGKPVTLIGDLGGPKYSHWAFGGGNVDVNSHREFQIDAFSRGLLELLPASLPSMFILRAQVLQPTVTPSEAGLYFAFSEQGTSQGVVQSFMTLSFSEREDDSHNPDDKAKKAPAVKQAKAPQVLLNLHSFRGQGTVPGDSRRGSTGVARKIPLRPQGTPALWRTLAVKVMPQAVEAFWEGKSIGTWHRDDPLFGPRRLFEGFAEIDPRKALAPEGGLGLYVFRGEAAFRQVIVEPVK